MKKVFCEVRYFAGFLWEELLKDFGLQKEKEFLIIDQYDNVARIKEKDIGEVCKIGKAIRRDKFTATVVLPNQMVVEIGQYPLSTNHLAH